MIIVNEIENSLMKKIALLLLILTATSLSAQDINWISMQKAFNLQETSDNPRKIFVYVYTNWCGPCKLLSGRTFKNPDVIKYINENFYAVKFNAEGNDVFDHKGRTFMNPNYKEGKPGRNSQHIFVSALKLKAYPGMAFFDEKSNFIFPITGFHEPRELEVFLKLINSNDYKYTTSMDRLEKYKADFVHTFSEH